MKLADLIIDWLNETSLMEMAHSRSDAKKTVTGLSPQIFKHLLKLFVFDSIDSHPHWLSELDTWLNEIDDIHLKPSNKKPNKNTLYNWLIFDSAPHYDCDYIRHTIKKWKRTDYKNVPLHEYDCEFVLNRILSIISDICEDIHDNKFYTVEDYTKN